MIVISLNFTEIGAHPHLQMRARQGYFGSTLNDVAMIEGFDSIAQDAAIADHDAGFACGMQVEPSVLKKQIDVAA